MSDQNQQSDVFEVPLAKSDALGEPVIWRYMDFPKVQDMLNRKTLFFASAKRFWDLQEGMFGLDYHEVYRDALRFTLPGPQGADLLFDDRDETIDFQLQWLQHPVSQHIFALKEQQPYVGISCWSCCETESIALWKSYSDAASGVAVKSRLSRVARSVSADETHHIHAGRVQYVPIRPAGLRESLFRPFIYKSSWYDYERELRFMAHFPTADEREDARSGWSIAVDLNELVEAIVIAPFASAWFKTLVETSVEKAGLSTDLVHSSAIAGTATRI
jgi:hypothetical protein